MTSAQKRKLGCIALKVVSLTSSIGLPVAAVLSEFPFWKQPPTGLELSAGGFMVLLIVLFGFRRELWPLIKDKLHINSAGALIFWGVCFAILLWLEGIAALLPALRTICIAGLVGTGLGQAATTAKVYVEKLDDKEVAPHD